MNAVQLRQDAMPAGRCPRMLAAAVCFVFAMASAALSVSQALAQTSPAAGAYVAVQDGSKQVPQLSLSVNELKGMSIMYATSQIAAVDGVLADAAGTPVAVVVTHGGFFGLFEKKAVLPLDRLTKGSGYLNSAVSDMAALPVWK